MLSPWLVNLRIVIIKVSKQRVDLNFLLRGNEIL